MSFKDFFKNIPQNWEIVTLPEVLSFIVDNRGKSVPTVENGIPLIATNCIRNERLYPTRDKIRYVSEDTYKNWFKSYPEPNDIIFVNKGTPGRVCLVPENIDFCFAQDMVALRANEKVDYRYLLACLRSEFFQEQVRSYSVGTMIPHCRKGDLEKLLLPLPTIKEQEYIGKIYLLFSEKIELNNEINNTLEEMAQSIFKRWFVDFEFPNEDGEPYKSSGGEMVDSELGMIPKGWEVKPLKELINLTMGLSPKSSTYNTNGEGMPLLNGAADFDTTNINPTKYTTDPKRLCKINDIIFCIRGTIGNVTFADGEYCLGRGVASLSPINDIDRGIIFLNLNRMIEILKSNASGSVILGISKSDIEEAKIVVAPKEIRELFNDKFKSIYKTIKNYNNSNINLIELRDSLLPKLMSGEIDLSK